MDQPMLYNLTNMERFKLRSKEKITRWDFFRTFKPPQHLSIESGNIWSKEVLNEGSIDYRYVSDKFQKTFGLDNNKAGGLFLARPKPNPFGVNPN